MQPIKIWENIREIDILERKTNEALRLVGELNTIYKTIHPSFSEGIQTDQIYDALFLETFVKDRMIALGGYTFTNGLALDTDRLRDLLKMPAAYSDYLNKVEEFKTAQYNPNLGHLRYDLLCNVKGEIVVDNEKYDDAVKNHVVYIVNTKQVEYYNDIKSLIDSLNKLSSQGIKLRLVREGIELLELEGHTHTYSLSWFGASHIKKIE